MKKTRRTFSAEFKAKAIKLVKAGTKDVTQIARELDVPRQLLYHWARQSAKLKGKPIADVFPGSRETWCRRDGVGSAAAQSRAARGRQRDLKKSDGLLRETPPLRFGFVHANRERHHVVAMCRNLNVSKAGYYAWRGRGQSARLKRDAELVAKIKRVHGESRGRYGAPRILAELQAEGVRVSGNASPA